MRTFLPSFVTALSRKNNDKQLHSPFRYSAFVSFMPSCLSQPCYLSTSAYVLPTLSLGLSNNPRKLNDAKFIHSFPFTTMLWLGGLGKETRVVYFSSHSCCRTHIIILLGEGRGQDTQVLSFYSICILLSLFLFLKNKIRKWYIKNQIFGH